MRWYFCCPQDESKEAKKRALSSQLGGGAAEEGGDARQDEERRIKALMKGMAQAAGDEVRGGKPSMLLYMYILYCNKCMVKVSSAADGSPMLEALDCRYYERFCVGVCLMLLLVSLCVNLRGVCVY